MKNRAIKPRRRAHRAEAGAWRLVASGAPLLAAMALAGSGCLAVLGNFDDRSGSEPSASSSSSTSSTSSSSSSSASSTSSSSTSGGGTATSSSSGGGSGGAGGSGVGGSAGAGGAVGAGGAGGSVGAGGAGGAGGSGPVIDVLCNGQQCGQGMVCCHEIVAASPANDYCADPGTCGGGFGEFVCNSGADCGGDVCCADFTGFNYNSASCQPTCIAITEVILCDDDSACVPPKVCKPSAKLGSGYNFCG